jgi:hypothetical protein
MNYLSVKITGLVSDDFPGFVEIQFNDSNGKTHTFVEKLLVVEDKDYLTLQGPYPRGGMIACEIVQENISNNTVLIDTAKPWGIETQEGQTIFTVATTLITERDD